MRPLLTRKKTGGTLVMTKRILKWLLSAIVLLACYAVLRWYVSYPYHPSEANAALVEIRGRLGGGKAGPGKCPQAEFYCRPEPRRVTFIVYNGTDADSQDEIVSVMRQVWAERGLKVRGEVEFYEKENWVEQNGGGYRGPEKLLRKERL